MKTRTWAFVVGGLLAGALTLGTLAVARAQSSGSNGHGSGMGGMGGMGGMMHGAAGSMMAGSMDGMMDELGVIDLAAGTAMTPEQVGQAMQQVLNQAGRGDLIVGDVTTSEQYYHAVATNRDSGAAVLELMADRTSGAVFACDDAAMMGDGMHEQMDNGGAMDGHDGMAE